MVGIAGFEREQDCLVKVILKDTGGLNIRINSKLKQLFGKLMLEAAKDAASEMKVENADIEVSDFGSLDFAIRARVKTAIRRARGAKYEQA